MINNLKISNLIYYLLNITIISLIAISLTKDFKSIDGSLPGFGGDGSNILQQHIIWQNIEYMTMILPKIQNQVIIESRFTLYTKYF